MITTIINILVGAALVYQGYGLVRSGRAGEAIDTWKQSWKAALRPSSLGWAGVTLPVTALAFAGLYALGGPMKWGWMSLLTHGQSSGNAAVASNGSLISLIVLGILFIMLPLLAHGEEVGFRRNNHTFKDMLRSNCIFGPLHMLMGIPLAGGIALILPGMIWSFVYFRAYKRDKLKNPVQATEYVVGEGDNRTTYSYYDDSIHRDRAVYKSTGAHLAHNSILVGLLLLVLIYTQ